MAILRVLLFRARYRPGYQHAGAVPRDHHEVLHFLLLSSRFGEISSLTAFSRLRPRCSTVCRRLPSRLVRAPDPISVHQLHGDRRHGFSDAEWRWDAPHDRCPQKSFSCQTPAFLGLLQVPFCSLGFEERLLFPQPGGVAQLPGDQHDAPDAFAGARPLFRTGVPSVVGVARIRRVARLHPAAFSDLVPQPAQVVLAEEPAGVAAAVVGRSPGAFMARVATSRPTIVDLDGFVASPALFGSGQV